MVKKGFLRANIPFAMKENIEYYSRVLADGLKIGWKNCDIQGNLLLKHINTSLNKNVICFSKDYEGIPFSVPMNDHEDMSVCHCYEFTVTQINVFCFDTGIGIVSLHIPYDMDTHDDTLVNTCSILRCSAEHQNAENGKAVLYNGRETYISSIAEHQLTELIGDTFTMFDQFNENSLRRIDMFSAVLCDKETYGDSQCYDKLCYRLANAYDNRDKSIALHEEEFYRHHDYNRWSFTKRGCCVVANLTGLKVTDDFLEKRWFNSIKSNYFYLYLMVLHQKYAIYNYLNAVAADIDKIHIKFNQEALIEFNSKYIFSIVSDEQLIQSTYLRMKQVNNVDEVYLDLEDELKRLFDYSQLINEKNNELRNSKLNILSVIISILCSASIIFETINMFSAKGFTPRFDTRGNIVCAVVILLEIIFFVAGLVYVLLVNNKGGSSKKRVPGKK